MAAPYNEQAPEKILAAPRQATADSGTAFTCTATATEAGWYDLGRMVFEVAADAAVANFSAVRGVLAPYLEIQSIVWQGSTPFTRGAGGATQQAMPGDMLSGFRSIARIAGLPRYLYMRTGNTIAVTALYTLAGITGDALLGIPFVPEGWRDKRSSTMNGRRVPWGDSEVVWSGPDTAVADATAVAVTATVQSDGFVDLDRLVCRSNLVSPLLNYPTGDLIGNLGIRSLVLSNNPADRIVGSGTAEAPGSMFWGRRSAVWARLGQYQVESQDTLALTYFTRTGQAGAGSFALPQYVVDGQSRGAYDPNTGACGC